MYVSFGECNYNYVAFKSCCVLLNLASFLSAIFLVLDLIVYKPCAACVNPFALKLSFLTQSQFSVLAWENLTYPYPIVRQKLVPVYY